MALRRKKERILLGSPSTTNKGAIWGQRKVHHLLSSFLLWSPSFVILLFGRKGWETIFHIWIRIRISIIEAFALLRAEARWGRPWKSLNCSEKSPRIIKLFENLFSIYFINTSIRLVRRRRRRRGGGRWHESRQSLWNCIEYSLSDKWDDDELRSF